MGVITKASDSLGPTVPRTPPTADTPSKTSTCLPVGVVLLTRWAGCGHPTLVGLHPSGGMIAPNIFVIKGVEVSVTTPRNDTISVGIETTIWLQSNRSYCCAM